MRLVDPPAAKAEKVKPNPSKNSIKNARNTAFKVKSTKKQRDDEKAELIAEWRAQHDRVVVP